MADPHDKTSSDRSARAMQQARLSSPHPVTGTVNCHACNLSFESHGSLAQHLATKHDGINSESVKMKLLQRGFATNPSSSVHATSSYASVLEKPSFSSAAPQPQPQSQPQPQPKGHQGRAKGTLLTLADLLDLAERKKKQPPPPPAPVIKAPNLSSVTQSKNILTSMVLPEGLRLKGAAKRLKPSRMKKLVVRTRADAQLKSAQEAHDSASEAFDSLAEACRRLLDDLSLVEAWSSLKEPEGLVGEGECVKGGPIFKGEDEVKEAVLRQAIAHAEKRLRSAAELMESSEKRLMESKVLRDKAYKIKEEGEAGQEEVGEGEEEEEEEEDASDDDNDDDLGKEEEQATIMPPMSSSRPGEGAQPAIIALSASQPMDPPVTTGPNLLGLSLFDDEDDEDEDEVDGLRGWTDVMGKWTGALSSTMGPGGMMIHPSQLFTPTMAPADFEPSSSDKPRVLSNPLLSSSKTESQSPVSTTISALDPEVAETEISSQNSIRSKIVGDSLLNRRGEKSRPSSLTHQATVSGPHAVTPLAPASSPSNFGLAGISSQMDTKSMFSEINLPSDWARRQDLLSLNPALARTQSDAEKLDSNQMALSAYSFDSSIGAAKAKPSLPNNLTNPNRSPMGQMMGGPSSMMAQNQAGSISNLLEALSSAAASNPFSLIQPVQRQTFSRTLPPAPPLPSYPMQRSMPAPVLNMNNIYGWHPSYQPNPSYHPMEQMMQQMMMQPPLVHTAQPFVPSFQYNPAARSYPHPHFNNHYHGPQQPGFETNRELECSLCGISCNSRATLQQHLESKKHQVKAARQAAADAEAASQALEGAVLIRPPPGDQVHPLCKQMISPEIGEVASDLLTRLKVFHDRAYAKNPIKANAHKLYLCGLREVKKAVKQGKAKAVIVAPNIERMEAVAGGLDDLIAEIVTACGEQGVPCVFALSRKRLGRVYGSRKKVSAVALLDTQSLEDVFARLLVMAEEGRRSFEELLLSGTPVQIILEPEEDDEEADGKIDMSEI